MILTIIIKNSNNTKKIWLEEVDLLRQVAEAPIGGEEITDKAWHLQARHYGNTTTPNLQHSFTTVSTAIQRKQVQYWQVLLQLQDKQWNLCLCCRGHVSTVSHVHTGKQVDVVLHVVFLQCGVVLTVKAGRCSIICSITAVWCSTDSEGG